MTVLGVPGIGKSRLVREALDEIRTGAGIVVGRCPPYGEGITYLPLLDIVRQLAPAGAADLTALVEGEDDGELIADRVAGAVGLSATSAPTAETNWAVRKLFEALARHRPLVVVLDDLHWAEPTFLDLVEHVAGSTRDVPLLVICLARPELLDARPAWQAPSDNTTTVRLEPLAENEAAALLERALRARVVDEQTGRRALEAAEGNPLFLEQLLAIQAEHGEQLGVPPTVQAVLAARIDRLPPAERTVAQRASVQGRAFSRRALAELVGDRHLATLDVTLGALQRRELIQRDPRAFGGADGLRFSHGLIRDAAYRFLPKETRSELHERLARWLDRAAEQPLGEQEEVVGYHLEQAYHYRAELGRVGARERALGAEAARRLDSSGRRAFARSDLPAAVKLLERAEALLSRDDRARAELLPSLGAALTEAGRLSEADRVLEAAVDCSRVNDDERLEAHAVVEQLFLRIQVDTEKAIDRGPRAGRAAAGDLRGQPGRPWSVQAVASSRAGALARGQVPGGRRRLGAGSRIRPRDQEMIGSVRRSSSWLASSAFIGPTPVGEAIRRCEAIREQVHEDRGSAAATLYPLAGLYAMIGRFDEARELLDLACRTLEDLGFVTLSFIGLRNTRAWSRSLPAI